MKWVHKIIAGDIFFQGNQCKPSKSIGSYILFIGLIVPTMYYILPKKIGCNTDSLLCALLTILIFMISFFNWFLVYRKSKILFIAFYVLPIIGIVISSVWRDVA